MKTLHWILGALGAAALAFPAAASADDLANQPDNDQYGVESSDDQVQVEGNGDSVTADDDDDSLNVEGNGDNDGATIEGNGDNDTWSPDNRPMGDDQARIEGQGDNYPSDSYAEARARQQERERKGPDKGLKVEAQGGVLSYPGEAASQVTPGAMYGVVVGIEPPIPVFELELGYQGAAYQTDQRLTGAQENAIENGGQAVLMASPEIGAFEPYVFGGYQISRLNVFERPNATGALQDDTLSKAPVGAGFDVHLGDVLVGARGTYSFVFNNDAFTNIDTSNSSREADQVSGSLLVGGQF